MVVLGYNDKGIDGLVYAAFLATFVFLDMYDHITLDLKHKTNRFDHNRVYRTRWENDRTGFYLQPQTPLLCISSK